MARPQHSHKWFEIVSKPSSVITIRNWNIAKRCSEGFESYSVEIMDTDIFLIDRHSRVFNFLQRINFICLII